MSKKLSKRERDRLSNQRFNTPEVRKKKMEEEQEKEAKENQGMMEANRKAHQKPYVSSLLEANRKAHQRFLESLGIEGQDSSSIFTDLGDGKGALTITKAF